MNTLTTSRKILDPTTEIEKSKDMAVRRSLGEKIAVKEIKNQPNAGVVSKNYSTVDFLAVPEANIEIGRIHSD